MGINVETSCEMALSYYQQVATKVADQINPFGNRNSNGMSTNQIVHRVRLYDEEENLSGQQQQQQSSALLDDDLVQYYQLLADRGDVQAQYGLGLLHYQGANIEVNLEKALYYFSRAADAGNYYAMAYLGKKMRMKEVFKAIRDTLSQ
jgi:SEL1 protein